jgi:hypothetical protein
LAFGFWLLAFGFWLLAFGFWLLAFGLIEGVQHPHPVATKCDKGGAPGEIGGTTLVVPFLFCGGTTADTNSGTGKTNGGNTYGGTICGFDGGCGLHRAGRGRS